MCQGLAASIMYKWVVSVDKIKACIKPVVAQKN